jgi:hypothetical protein
MLKNLGYQNDSSSNEIGSAATEMRVEVPSSALSRGLLQLSLLKQYSASDTTV